MEYKGTEWDKRVRMLLDKRTSINLETGCWEYQGTNADGYGQITIDQEFFYVHRLSAELFLGYNPTSASLDMHILHKCQSKNCWNPEHLYIGTNEENIQDKVVAGTGRGKYSDVTHCVNGHEFTEENTYWSRRATGEMRRQCRECRRINDIKQKEKKRMLKFGSEN